MIRFLKKMSVFLIAYLVVAVVFFLLVPAQYPTSYDAAIQDKIDRLEKIESPKIILPLPRWMLLFEERFI